MLLYARGVVVGRLYYDGCAMVSVRVHVRVFVCLSERACLCGAVDLSVSVSFRFDGVRVTLMLE